jgi:hypothetical protein
MSEAADTLAATDANPAPTDATNTAPVAGNPPAETQAEVDPLTLVPDSPDEYGIQFEEDPDSAKLVAEWFKDAGLTKAQAQALAEKRAAAWADHQAKQAEAAKAEEARIASQVEADDSALKKEWGDRYDANIELGRRAVRQFEIPSDVLEAVEAKVGYGQMLRMFSRIGRGLAEDSAVGLSNSAGERTGNTPESKLYPNMK